MTKTLTLQNFERVGAGELGHHVGEFFVDSDLYKWLEAVGWAMTDDAAGEMTTRLRQWADEGIGLVQNAQAGDGYLQTWFQLRPGEPRFADLAAAHELYCAGQLFQAAVAFPEPQGTKDCSM